MTIEGSIRNLAPDEELLDLGKPVFAEWLNSHGNKWSFIWRIIQSQPLFKIFHSAVEFLETPNKLEQLKESEQRREFQFAIFENRKKQLFQLILIGLIGVGAGYYLADDLIWQLSAGLTGIALACYGVTSYKLGKWLKYMPVRRR